jgi:3-hydroxy-9,10-secoandrosta-1,3,5(10)-triene-9,17-dione monooxygenase
MTKDKMIGVARQFAAELESLESDIIKTGSIPDSIIEEMKKAGMFRLIQPKQYGGFEVEPHTLFEIQGIFSQALMSAGWLVGLLNLQSWQLGLMAPQAQNDVWSSEPDALISSSFMPVGKVQKADGGYIVSGHWRYSSGCTYSSWILLGGLIHEEGHPPDYRAFLIPRKECRIIEDWQVVGLQETLSHSVTTDEVFVPEHRTFRAVSGFNCDCPGLSVNSGELFRIPFGQLFGLCIALPAVGALEGAVTKGIQDTENPKLKTSSSPTDLQLALANANSTVQDCKVIAQENIDFLIRQASEYRVPTLRDRTRIRLDSTRISQKCLQAAAELFTANGTSSLLVNNKYSRVWQDISASNMHAGNSIARFGRLSTEAMMGRDVYDPLL